MTDKMRERNNKIQELHSKGLSRGEIARELGISKTTVANCLIGYPVKSKYSGHDKAKTDSLLAEWDATCKMFRR